MNSNVTKINIIYIIIAAPGFKICTIKLFSHSPTIPPFGCACPTVDNPNTPAAQNIISSDAVHITGGSLLLSLRKIFTANHASSAGSKYRARPIHSFRIPSVTFKRSPPSPIHEIINTTATSSINIAKICRQNPPGNSYSGVDFVLFFRPRVDFFAPARLAVFPVFVDLVFAMYLLYHIIYQCFASLMITSPYHRSPSVLPSPYRPLSTHPSHSQSACPKSAKYATFRRFPAKSSQTPRNL